MKVGGVKEGGRKCERGLSVAEEAGRSGWVLVSERTD